MNATGSIHLGAYQISAIFQRADGKQVTLHDRVFGSSVQDAINLWLSGLLRPEAVLFVAAQPVKG